MRARHLHWALLPTMIGAAIFEDSLHATSDDGAPHVTLAPNNPHDGGPLVIEMDTSSYDSSPSGCKSETISLPNKTQAVKHCTCEPESDYDYVENGQECVYFSNASVIQVGTCNDGKCTEKNLTTHKVSKNPREQHYNPEDDLCMQLTMKVNQDFFPVSRCQVYCRGWGVRPLNDERLCVLRTKEISSVFGKKKRVVTKTGVCRRGVCVEANMTPWRHPKGCKDRNVKHGGKILAENCTSFCDNGVREEREEGTICLLEKKSSWIKDVIIKGICRKGMCIKTPPLDGTLVVWDPNIRCAVYQEQVTPTKFAAPMCSMYCSGRFKPMQDGTPCVLERSFDFWWKPKVKQLGVCRLGRCIEKGPSVPGAHLGFHRGCVAHNVHVETGKLTVAACCQVECANFVFENRMNGTLCLLQYEAFQIFLGRWKKIYVIGECQSGSCVLGRYSRVIDAP
uniref:Putative secreted protein n=1 Tax=Ixodes ricinus TaxID=34613 RepID=A0A0K8R448_IXORI